MEKTFKTLSRRYMEIKATSHQTDAGIPQEESKDAVLGQTSGSMSADQGTPEKTGGIYLRVSELEHSSEVSPIVAKIV